MAAGKGQSNTTTNVARVVVDALAQGPLSGYEIATSIAGRVPGRFIGWLYPALYRLEAHGAITAEWQAAGGKVRRRYSLLGAATGRFGTSRRLAAQMRRRGAADRPGPAAEPAPVADYLDLVMSDLAAPPAEKIAVRRELADHMEDAGSVDDLERVFGRPEQLARALFVARSERRSLASALSTAVPISLGVFLFATAVTAFALPWLRVAAEIAVRVAFPSDAWGATAGLNQRQQSFPLVVGAFVGARYWAGAVLAAGRARGPLTVIGASAAALVVGIPAFCLQIEIDPLAAATMVAIPGAVVLGTLTPTRPLELPVSRRGIAAAVALGFALIVAPLNGIFVYSVPGGMENDHPGVYFDMEPITNFDANGAQGVFVISDREAATEVCLEARPLVIAGWRAEPDPSVSVGRACQPVVVEKYLNLNVPAPQAQGKYWAVTASIVRPDGTTAVLGSRVAAPRNSQSIVGWLADTLTP